MNCFSMISFNDLSRVPTPCSPVPPTWMDGSSALYGGLVDNANTTSYLANRSMNSRINQMELDCEYSYLNNCLTDVEQDSKISSKIAKNNITEQNI